MIECPLFLTPKLPAYVAVIILIIFNQTGVETRERRWSEWWGCDTRAREEKEKFRKIELSFVV